VYGTLGKLVLSGRPSLVPSNNDGALDLPDAADTDSAGDGGAVVMGGSPGAGAGAGERKGTRTAGSKSRAAPPRTSLT
jgi:hypothetical protein